VLPGNLVAKGTTTATTTKDKATKMTPSAKNTLDERRMDTTISLSRNQATAQGLRDCLAIA
jgi:ethanolamine utilization cobalamin adenosyltransferase